MDQLVVAVIIVVVVSLDPLPKKRLNLKGLKVFFLLTLTSLIAASTIATAIQVLLLEIEGVEPAEFSPDSFHRSVFYLSWLALHILLTRTILYQSRFQRKNT